MSYLALYRKYRPSTFDDVVGQDHIVTTLKNQIKANRLGHAYLFCGTRGTGKTSVAKLLAKAVNCENPKDGSPCGQCAMCKAADAGVSMNVVEMDAASNNGVDNIRDIVNDVRYSPAEGKYKVYIIDEVHMLSAGAFNALLKTLEEPPSYVIFILATTEVHKLPITILSRCQRYDFRRITVDTITGNLRRLMESEGINAEEKALRYVAKVGDGSMRDSQSLLDQCIAFNLGQDLTYERVLEVLGTVDVETFAMLLRYIRGGQVKEAVRVLDEVIAYGRELVQFVNDFTWYLRNLLIAKTAEDPGEVLELPKERMEMVLHEAEIIDEETLIRYIRIMSQLSTDMKYAAQKRLMLEVALIKLCKPQMETDYSSVVNRMKILEERLENGDFARSASEEGRDDYKSEGMVLNTPPAVLQKALSDDLKNIAESWGTIASKMSPILRTTFAGVTVSVGDHDKLLLVADNEWDYYLISGERSAEIKATIEKVTGKTVELEFRQAGSPDERRHDFPDITKLFGMPIDFID